MFFRVFVIFSILLALFGVFIAPGIVTRGSRRRAHALHRFHPDEGKVPWDLTDWVPVGFVDREEIDVRREWRWMPRFRIVK